VTCGGKTNYDDLGATCGRPLGIRFGFQPWNAAVVRSGCICWAHGGGTRKRVHNPTRIASSVNGVRCPSASFLV
jgi:hypothetical protein